MGLIFGNINRHIDLTAQLQKGPTSKPVQQKQEAFQQVTHLISRRFAEQTFKFKAVFEQTCRIILARTNTDALLKVKELASLIQRPDNSEPDQTFIQHLAILFESQRQLFGPDVPHGAQKLLAFLWVIQCAREGNSIFNDKGDFDFDRFKKSLPKEIAMEIWENYFRQVVLDVDIHDLNLDIKVDKLAYRRVQFGQHEKRYRCLPMILYRPNPAESALTRQSTKVCALNKLNLPSALEIKYEDHHESFQSNGYAYLFVAPESGANPTTSRVSKQSGQFNVSKSHHAKQNMSPVLRELPDDETLYSFDKDTNGALCAKICQAGLQNRFIVPIEGCHKDDPSKRVFYVPTVRNANERFIFELPEFIDLPGPAAINACLADLLILHTKTDISARNPSRFNVLWSPKSRMIVRVLTQEKFEFRSPDDITVNGTPKADRGMPLSEKRTRKPARRASEPHRPVNSSSDEFEFAETTPQIVEKCQLLAVYQWLIFGAELIILGSTSSALKETFLALTELSPDQDSQQKIQVQIHNCVLNVVNLNWRKMIHGFLQFMQADFDHAGQTKIALWLTQLQIQSKYQFFAVSS